MHKKIITKQIRFFRTVRPLSNLKGILRNPSIAMASRPAIKSKDKNKIEITKTKSITEIYRKK